MYLMKLADPPPIDARQCRRCHRIGHYAERCPKFGKGDDGIDGGESEEEDEDEKKSSSGGGAETAAGDVMETATADDAGTSRLEAMAETIKQDLGILVGAAANRSGKSVEYCCYL